MAEFCQRWHIIEFALFGSVLRDDFRPDSDVDVWVVYQANFQQTLEDKIEAKTELETLFNREVNITRKQGLVNPFSREEIIQEYCIIYLSEKAQLITLKISNKTMQDNVRNSAAIWDMLEAIKRIQTFTQGLDDTTYLDNLWVQRAVERNLEIQGKLLLE
ncbi:MAG: nucleotidyltransferase domain-containing protein [Microcoleaceae cyanobacterium]